MGYKVPSTRIVSRSRLETGEERRLRLVRSAFRFIHQDQKTRDAIRLQWKSGVKPWKETL